MPDAEGMIGREGLAEGMIGREGLAEGMIGQGRIGRGNDWAGSGTLQPCAQRQRSLAPVLAAHPKCTCRRTMGLDQPFKKYLQEDNVYRP
eukprot:1161756-Pelagomonas_calceolata.AAC.8